MPNCNPHIDRKRKRMFVVPRLKNADGSPSGLKVRMHNRLDQHLPEKGAWVPRSMEWMRSLADGDVEFPAVKSKSTKTKKQ